MVLFPQLKEFLLGARWRRLMYFTTPPSDSALNRRSFLMHEASYAFPLSACHRKHLCSCAATCSRRTKLDRHEHVACDISLLPRRHTLSKAATSHASIS